MNWYKAKTILIVFFIIMNLFLLVNIMYSADKAYVITPDVIDSTVSILSNNDIYIDKDIIPTKTVDMTYAEVVNTITDYETFARKFISNPKSNVDGNKNLYTDNDKTITFNGDTFKFECNTPILGSQLTDINKDNAIDKAKMIMQQYGFNINKISSSVKVVNDQFIVIISQIINDKPIFDSSLSFTMSSQGLYSIQGSWFEGNDDKQLVKNKISLKSVTSILIDFILYPTRPSGRNVITNIDLGYSTYENGIYHKSIVLIPAWQITLDDGSTYSIDSRETR